MVSDRAPFVELDRCAALAMKGAKMEMTSSCPAFAEGCPYGKNEQMLQWVKDKRHLMQFLRCGQRYDSHLSKKRGATQIIWV